MGRRGRAEESAIERQRRIYDEDAARYDRSMAVVERLWLSGGRAWLGARAGGRILDVAIGTGLTLPHYPTDAAVTGIDISSGMLAIARQRAAELGRAVELREGDAQQLPFADASFDTVVCALALCCVPDPARAVAEMHRVLVPGGRLLLLDHIGSSWTPIRWTQQLLERVTVPTAGEHFTRRSLPLVVAAGFTIDEAERLKAGTVERLSASKTSDGDASAQVSDADRSS
ncbi:methyltransferase domain-containing protein [Agrococcus sp. ProA11]|uniref:class I SAM-dependent methyltransferase n=1 Tax=Agrococcus chionoecetis TaxID=3153752 RepID=UPI003260E674